MSKNPLITFWDFATGLYGREGVKAVSLALQDERGDDVLFVFACLYAAIEGGGTLAVAPLLKALEPWQSEVTERLRAARRAAGPGALAQQILAAELAAERIAYDRAEPLLGPFGAPRTRDLVQSWAQANFWHYRAETGRGVTAEDEARFAVLIASSANPRVL